MIIIIYYLRFNSPPRIVGKRCARWRWRSPLRYFNNNIRSLEIHFLLYELEYRGPWMDWIAGQSYHVEVEPL